MSRLSIKFLCVTLWHMSMFHRGEVYSYRLTSIFSRSCRKTSWICRCAAYPANARTDHALRLTQKAIAQDFFLCLLRQNRDCVSKGSAAQWDGLAADSKGVFLVRLGKLNQLLIRQIIKGNFPFPFLPQPYDFPDGCIPNGSFPKGVVLSLAILLIGFNLGHGNSPLLDNRMGRQHLLLSPLDCLPAKAGGAVNGGAYTPFILAVDWLGWVLRFFSKIKYILKLFIKSNTQNKGKLSSGVKLPRFNRTNGVTGYAHHLGKPCL